MQQAPFSVRVLLIEKDSYYREAVSEFLRSLNDCILAIAESLEEAAKRIAANMPDVILLAEGEDPEETFQWFRSINSEFVPACIIVSIANENVDAQDGYRNHGAWDCLAKSNKNYFTEFGMTLKRATIAVLDNKLHGAVTSDNYELSLMNSSKHLDQAFQVSQRVLHYRILSVIGQGGMGQVYKATDDKLGRTVAIKVLPPTMESKAARRRLNHEARAASALNHHNIVTVYAIEQFQGSDFIVMEYINGNSLREILHSGPLSTPDLLRLGIQLAEALSVAHPAGLIHRDIKPANIMITPTGTIKLLDFGLAKQLRPSEPISDITATGVIVGTITYMSPEQAQGEDLDARTDIFSLGAVLYQAATGSVPFQGKTAIAIMHEIVMNDPIDPCSINHSLPSKLGTTILRALSKKKELRFQSASELANELKQMEFASSSATSEKQSAFLPQPGSNRLNSIAVMPFGDPDSNSELEYLSRGITENLLNSLSQIPNLRVVPRSTVFRYYGKEFEASEVGRSLNVAAVVTGRIVEHSGTLNIQAELTDVVKQSQIWGAQFKRKITDIFHVQEEIATEIARRLKPRLSGKDKEKLLRRATQDIDAYHFYLKGRYQLSKRTRDSISKAAGNFKAAIEKDERYSLAYSGMADSLNLLASYAYKPPRRVLSLAMEAAKKALEINPKLGEAHTSIGYTLLLSRKLDLAEKALLRAIKLNPRYSLSYVWLGLLLNLSGRFDEAATYLQKALQLEPLSVIANLNQGLLFFAQKKYEKAKEQFLFTLETEIHHPATQFFLGLTYEASGSLPQATKILEKCVEASPDVRYIAALAHAYSTGGNNDAARKTLVELERRVLIGYVSPTDFAVIHLGLQQYSEALLYLEQAMKDLSSWWNFLNIDPRFDPIRGTSEFQQLLRDAATQQD